jgi:hypothetical protein
LRNILLQTNLLSKSQKEAMLFPKIVFLLVLSLAPVLGRVAPGNTEFIRVESVAASWGDEIPTTEITHWRPTEDQDALDELFLQPIGQGGAGSVFIHPNFPTSVFKRLHKLEISRVWREMEAWINQSTRE